MADRRSLIADRNGSTRFRKTRDSRRRTRDLFALTTLCLLLYLPGLATLPPVDRDEARFMQTTRQMVESGDYVRPRFQDEDRFRKPAGIYWLQSLSVRLLGNGDPSQVWPYRLPSLFGAVSAVLLTYLFGALWYPRVVALSAAALLAGSVLLVVEAHLATTDAALLALIVLAQGCLGVLYLRGQHAPAWYAFGFWLALGLAVLIKGPVAPMISALTIVALLVLESFRARARARNRNRSSFERLRGTITSTSTASLSTKDQSPEGRHLLTALRWHWGIALALLVILPWAVAVGYQTDGAFFREWWNGDVLPKLVSGHESHGWPPGMHLLILPATFWPGSLLLIPALMFVRSRRRAIERFCLAWLVPSWLVCELVPTKLPHYVLPLLPPLALIGARALWSHRLVTPRRRAGVAVAAATTALLALITFGAILPNWHGLWLSRDAVRAIATHGQAERPLAAAGYHEPSLVFLTGGTVRLVDPSGLAAFLQRHPSGLGLISAEEQIAFQRAAAAHGFATRVLWTGDGINYSKGRRMRLLLLSRAPILAHASHPAGERDQRRGAENAETLSDAL